jgi:hypothetical protein
MISRALSVQRRCAGLVGAEVSRVRGEGAPPRTCPSRKRVRSRAAVRPARLLAVSESVAMRPRARSRSPLGAEIRFTLLGVTDRETSDSRLPIVRGACPQASCDVRSGRKQPAFARTSRRCRVTRTIEVRYFVWRGARRPSPSYLSPLAQSGCSRGVEPQLPRLPGSPRGAPIGPRVNAQVGLGASTSTLFAAPSGETRSSSPRTIARPGAAPARRIDLPAFGRRSDPTTDASAEDGAVAFHAERRLPSDLDVPLLGRSAQAPGRTRPGATSLPRAPGLNEGEAGASTAAEAPFPLPLSLTVRRLRGALARRGAWTRQVAGHPSTAAATRPTAVSPLLCFQSGLTLVGLSPSRRSRISESTQKPARVRRVASERRERESLSAQGLRSRGRVRLGEPPRRRSFAAGATPGATAPRAAAGSAAEVRRRDGSRRTRADPAGVQRTAPRAAVPALILDATRLPPGRATERQSKPQLLSPY